MAYKDPTDPRSAAAKLKHYYANKQQYYDRNAKVKAEKLAWLREQKAVPCMDCGHRYPYYVMQFDHRDPADKLGHVGRMISFGWAKMKAEVTKCDVVCANCHAERTHQQRLTGLI